MSGSQLGGFLIFPGLSIPGNVKLWESPGRAGGLPKGKLDRDLADFYEVTTKALNQAVKRNERRFPPDFMFRLTKEEKKELVTNCDRFQTLKHSSVLPSAFAEQGVAMLSSVLNNERAIQVNVAIMRAFVRLRQLLGSHKELAHKLEELERHLKDHDKQIQTIFSAIRQLMVQPEPSRKQIGFYLKERHGPYMARVKKKHPN